MIDINDINKDTPMEELTPGGIIWDAGNAVNFKTGDWRVYTPVWNEEKCKQCGLCFPVCPEDSIKVDKDMKRKDTNLEYCKGCGVCAKVCPFAAIDMKEV